MARKSAISKLKDKVKKALPKVKLNRSEKIATVGTAISVATAIYTLSKDSNTSTSRSANVTGLDTVSTQALVEAVKNSPELITLLRGFAGANGANGANGTNGESAFEVLQNTATVVLTSSQANKMLIVNQDSIINTINTNAIPAGSSFLFINAKNTTVGLQRAGQSLASMFLALPNSVYLFNAGGGDDLNGYIFKGTNGTDGNKIKFVNSVGDFQNPNLGDICIYNNTFDVYEYTTLPVPAQQGEPITYAPAWDYKGVLKGANGTNAPTYLSVNTNSSPINLDKLTKNICVKTPPPDTLTTLNLPSIASATEFYELTVYNRNIRGVTPVLPTGTVPYVAPWGATIQCSYSFEDTSIVFPIMGSFKVFYAFNGSNAIKVHIVIF